MTIDQSVLNALKDNQHFVALQKYLAGKALELNTVTDIKRTSPELMAAEVIGKQIAYEKIVRILEGLVPVDKSLIDTGNNSEYAVE